MENFTIDTTLYPIADNPSILLSESYPTFAPMNEMQSLDFWDFGFEEWKPYAPMIPDFPNSYTGNEFELGEDWGSPVEGMPYTPQPVSMTDVNGGCTDMFGQPITDPFNVDIMSGLPCSSFDHGMADAMHEMRVEKLENSHEIESQRDIAVKHYQEAKQTGDVDEMLKWETIANKEQGNLYDLWGTPTYGLVPKAPGIE